MRSFLRLFVITLCASLLYGFGEQPKDTAVQAKSIYPASAQQLIDGKLNTGAAYKMVILDLGTDQYLESIQLYQKEIPEKIQTSSDGISYDSIPTTTITITDNFLSCEATGYNGRYVKVTNSTTLNGNEIKVYPTPNFRLTFVSINASPSTDSCKLYVKTQGKGYMQLLYGMNYDFIYNKVLLGSYAAMSLTNEEVVIITGLQPETTYRYQFKFRALQDTTVESNYFTFTTLPVVN